MRKLMLKAICIIASVFPLMSNAQAFTIDNKAVNIGIGIGGGYGVYSGASSMPQLNLSFEKGMWEVAGPGVVSLGAFIGHKAFKYKAADWKWSYTTIGVRSAYHYGGLDNDKVDLYGGLMLGYFIYKAEGYTAGSGGLGLDGFVGAR